MYKRGSHTEVDGDYGVVYSFVIVALYLLQVR